MRAGEEVEAVLAENENLVLTTIVIDTLPLKMLQIECPCLKPQPPVFLRVNVNKAPYGQAPPQVGKIPHPTPLRYVPCKFPVAWLELGVGQAHYRQASRKYASDGHIIILPNNNGPADKNSELDPITGNHSFVSEKEVKSKKKGNKEGNEGGDGPNNNGSDDEDRNLDLPPQQKKIKAGNKVEAEKK
ncbi:hypothetical protein K443DRAFT_8558 [Laccaria amethystina LaAM-08-1]|uniref:Uncharacterized protein n=1 Tax=Laccaria amethystina LaAM-08-1 TaxID=1095629 RepID=A0A0C9XCK1_9AGAR|nr:hypothetical protein K443DRAFT_8558 [Laccaria amethystina LaAM-08-1]